MAEHLLRAHELGRPGHDTAPGELGHARLIAQHLRKAEIQHRGPNTSRGVRVGHQHDVFRFEIAVEDLQSVRVLEPLADLNQQRDPLVDRQRAEAMLAHGQRLTREVRHHQIDAPFRRLAHAENGTHVRVLEPHGDDGLALEPLRRLLVPEQLGQQHLDGDLAVGFKVTREVDVRHPAFADPSVDAVAPAERLAGEAHVDGIGRLGGRLDRPVVPRLGGFAHGSAYWWA